MPTTPTTPTTSTASTASTTAATPATPTTSTTAATPAAPATPVTSAASATPATPHARSHLRRLPAPVRLALSALLAVGLVGLGVALHLAARTGPGSLWEALGPEATRLRVCAPPLERALKTSMREHIPDPRERATLVAWMRRGARMEEFFAGPSRLLAARCAPCHGQAPQAGVRLLTYHDALSLVAPEGRDPYRRLHHLHVHLFAVGAVLGLLLLGLGLSRYPTWVVRAVGLAPVIALLLSALLTLLSRHTSWAHFPIWLCDATAVLGWLIGSLLLLWDLWAPAPVAPAAQVAPSAPLR